MKIFTLLLLFSDYESYSSASDIKIDKEHYDMLRSRFNIGYQTCNEQLITHKTRQGGLHLWLTGQRWAWDSQCVRSIVDARTSLQSVVQGDGVSVCWVHNFYWQQKIIMPQ